MTEQGWGLDPRDWTALGLSVQLALVTTALLLAVACPLAWRMARRPSFWTRALQSVTFLPLVLPPSVLGFYLLVGFGATSPAGRLLSALGVSPLPFTFQGLVLASALCSWPFVLQPLVQAFEAIPKGSLEAAQLMGARPWDLFFRVILPLSRSGFVSSFLMGFTHILGEFGVVLMMGGNIPGETQVLSLRIYQHVESMELAKAHTLSGVLVLTSLVTLGALQWLHARKPLPHGQG